jgi:hypothetical protein
MVRQPLCGRQLMAGSFTSYVCTTMKHTKPRPRMLTGLLALLLVYTGSYIALSAAGRYEPAAIGLDHVKWYSWAPCGFVANYQWNRVPRIIYAPLYFLDTLLWHTNEVSESGRYPIHLMEGTDVGKIYEANGLCDPPSSTDGREQMPH